MNTKLSELLKHFQSPVTPKGLFISLEGIEGSGKSTQIKNLESFLKDQGLKVLTLREPGGTTLGEKLREAVLSSTTKLHPLAECHLFLASRAQLLQEKILPFLLEETKSAVILDRYVDSTLAYQGKARKLGYETILTLHQHNPLNLLPHRTYFLDISLETSLKRQEKRGNSKDYFESEKTEFYTSLIDGYREVSELFKERILTINAESAESEVTQALLSDVRRILP